ncbi:MULTISPECIES: type II toxin-antitoxin system prevent-host-death family antitoxin [Moorena]|uniref:Antitoxin n=1 Tax=Moorena producens 3L TaxID=489825 RepID=F4XP14_9CYAN|nr:MULTISPECIES: type II toxin-antitoxin system prevent-host-death family antitoxin [Moorena]NEQ15405.1 type II toxin-antitoxin system prevent-host-death family antitoxin [Moorena sp. SIO3E2]EGJ33785.1 PhdYefM prevent-host-death family protein [Moorena producens 3L]NEP31106.1 type II toxin-antitoxin system prevent-host-death family antitoxin [Moorena sp. SIO3B2]NEP69504.1 type II toxin-antitoxin system prevent-host-death family antitoxin [Moorena sp. SIO3A5]NEQ08723.1 type II toxin-antitoxin s
MKTLGASEAKNRFGELLDLARREPVKITKKGRNVAVVISIEEFERFLELEEELIAIKAKQAQQEGFIGLSESEELLEDIMNA